MSKRVKIGNIGGWPKYLEREPDRPHIRPMFVGDDWDDESDDSYVPYDINFAMNGRFRGSKNIYAAISVFVEFAKLGLYPPPWAIAELARRFERHLENPEPDLFAWQMGAQAAGSGSKNPYEEFVEAPKRFSALTEMCLLLYGFELSVSQAAKIVIEFFDMEISDNTLRNDYYRKFGNPSEYMLKNRVYDPLQDPFQDDEDLRQRYISAMPRHIQSLLRKKSPEKT